MNEQKEVDSSDGYPAATQIPIAHLIAAHPKLIRELQSVDCCDVVSVFGGLQTIPSLQTSCSRLEAMVHLAVAYAAGDQPLSKSAAKATFAELGAGLCGAMEDPAEDAFSTLVMSSKGNYRIIEGIWESAAFFLQRAVNITERLPGERGWEHLSESVFALLTLSDVVCERSGLKRTTFGTAPSEECFPRDDFDDLQNRVVFTPEDLAALGIRREAIEPFVFQPDLRNLISSVSLEHSPLLDYPLMQFGNRIVFALPTAVSIAVRRLLFGGLIRSGLRRVGVALLEYEYKHLLRRQPLFGLGRDVPVFFQDAGDCMVAEYSADIEPGRFMQFIFILDTLRGFDKDGFAGQAPHEPRPEFISDKITAFRSHIEQSGNVKEGVTVIVNCGIGRPSVGLSPLLSTEATGNWDTVFLSAADAETMTLLHITPQTVLRICQAKRILARQGVRLFNLNGFPNLVAWVRSLDGHLVDHSNMPDEMRTRQHLVLPTDMVLDLRRERAAKVDRHMTSLPNGQMVQVRRESGSFFADDVAQPLYIDETWNEEYGLRLVYLGEQVKCWCEVRPNGYERWKMLRTWLPRLGEALSTQLAVSNPISLLFQVCFDSQVAAGSEALETPNEEQIADSISIEVDMKTACIVTHVGESFEHGLADPRNISESMLVRRMIEGVLTLIYGEINAETLQSLHQAVVPNTDARDAHLFQARQFRDFVRNSISDSPVVVDPIDEGTDRLGLGWRHRSRDDGSQVDGKEDCSVFLSNVVRGIEDDLCADLRAFDRRRLILFALGNHEAAMVRQHRWRTTARANLGLHDSRVAALQTILDKESENNASLLASRVLVELALCECPTNGGVTPGEIDLARLMSKLLLVIHYGGWSDAIYYDAMQPSLRITPLGDIHGHVDFLTDVVEPFGRMTGEVMLDDAIDRYAHNFEIPETVPAVSDVFDQRFLAAWEAEKVVSIDDWRLFADLLEDIGRAEQKAVFSMRCSQSVTTGKAGGMRKAPKRGLKVNVIFQNQTLVARLGLGHASLVPEHNDALPLHPSQQCLHNNLVPKTNDQSNCLSLAPILG